MRSPHRHRPFRRTLAKPLVGVDLRAIAANATYIGSGEHKACPSFAGPAHLRADASRCDPTFADAEELTMWLRHAITAGSVGGPWEGRYPRYVWHRRAALVYEGRLVNQEQGQYKGYPLVRTNGPRGCRELSTF